MSKQPVGKKVQKSKKKLTYSVPLGIAHIKATFNNTIVVISDPAGRPLCWSSAGKVGFSGSRKSAAYAGTIAAQDAGKAAAALGVKEVEVVLKGAGAGREAAVRGLQSSGLVVNLIRDKTPVPFNGCRPRKRRRV